ncbi:hypothetical protein [Rhodopseudomonas pseudopalustris]|uniref:Uncharacterized protein n=1 Tax=Rhodopseudomonas pseudopalustris TaxID=1513892 RepID=A0A1H8WIV1_9BRAD|nr:hypothetical protein [Rhodopseudomonas pseudopalustris]SEP27562.1 hypothetical protein SAMN05444123_112134 [Rhodopseudomonas pseudopalustris]
MPDSDNVLRPVFGKRAFAIDADFDGAEAECVTAATERVFSDPPREIEPLSAIDPTTWTGRTSPREYVVARVRNLLPVDEQGCVYRYVVVQHIVGGLPTQDPCVMNGWFARYSDAAACAKLLIEKLPKGWVTYIMKLHSVVEA